MSHTTPPLFDRIPAGLFRPLSGANHRRYWDILNRLMSELWSDAGRSPGEELPKKAVVSAIESFLVVDDPWEEEMATPTEIRAHAIYTHFVDSGWLAERRRGVVDHATIRPIAAALLSTLVEFAYHEPEFLGSQVRSILLNLKQVKDGNEPALYPEAARQAKRVIEHIVRTGSRIHDLMDELFKLDSAPDFVKGFFEDYLEQVFIADYTEFRTHHHPLQNRAEIVRRTIELEHDDRWREALIDWYATQQTKGDRLKAEVIYERDTRLLKRLREVEEHLRRLDEEIRDANKRALAYFEYKMRSPGRFDVLIELALSAVGHVDEQHIGLPPRPMRPHAAAVALATPRRIARESAPTAVEEIPPTPEDLAKEALRKRMNEDRLITPLKLAAYIARHLGSRATLTSDDLEIASINDLCCYQRLLLIGLRDATPPEMRASDTHLNFVPGIRVRFEDAAITENAYMTHRRFIIEANRRQR